MKIDAKADKLIYVASPYSHPDPAVQDQRYIAVAKFTADLCERGILAYSPIAHGRGLLRAAQLPGDFAFWKRHNIAMLSRCDRVVVYCLQGWKSSIGVDGEIRAAKQRRILLDFVWPADAEQPRALELGYLYD